jgi:hypothetical protein
MTRQTTITVSGAVAENVRALVDQFPGANANRLERALVRTVSTRGVRGLGSGLSPPNVREGARAVVGTG